MEIPNSLKNLWKFFMQSLQGFRFLPDNLCRKFFKESSKESIFLRKILLSTVLPGLFSENTSKNLLKFLRRFFYKLLGAFQQDFFQDCVLYSPVDFLKHNYKIFFRNFFKELLWGYTQFFFVRLLAAEDLLPRFFWNSFQELLQEFV